MVLEQQFSELLSIINRHRGIASRAVNEQQLLVAWGVGGYVSRKLSSQEWGGKVVTQLSEFIRTKHPEIRGYSRRNIYNMVSFYDEYSSPSFQRVVNDLMVSQSVPAISAQANGYDMVSGAGKEIVQMVSAQSATGEGVQMPEVLKLTSLSNHIAILNQCGTPEERLFYVLYAHRERLTYKELQRCMRVDTYSSLLGSKRNMSRGLLETYPNAAVLFKDTTFVDFLGLPQRYSERRLRMGLVEHIKQFILELGKDFLFVDQEYSLEVGASTFKADLLFFHRGLQALVAIELKRRRFHPKDLGQLEFYLEALDRDVKRSNENPSIGIILCPEADKTVVEYAMSRSMSPTMVAEYKRQLIPKERMQVLLSEYCSMFAVD